MTANPTICKGSVILITGASGFIASHIVETFLAAGYVVRGTTRSASKLTKLQAGWNERYGPGKFQVAVVDDISKEGAFDDAVKGVSGIALVASVMSFSKVPAEVIDLVVDSTVSVLRSASKEPTVKSCVLTSSTSAAFRPQPNVEFDVEEDSWNMDCIKAAFELPDNDPRKGGYVYAASKVLGEKAAWKFVADEKPCFSFNVIIPSVNIGPVIDPTNYTSTAGWFKDIFDGNLGVMGQYPPQHYVDVRDTALLHFHALTSPTLASGGVRMFAAAGPYNINEILQIFRKLYPTKGFPANVESEDRDLSRIDNKRGQELLGGWRSLEESLKANTEGLI